MLSSRGRATREALTLVGAMTAANASNYVFHVVMTRLLGPGDYGALGALLGVMLVMGVPVNAVQAVVARRVAAAADSDEADRVVRTGLWTAGRAALFMAAALGILSPLVARFLHLTSPAPVLIVAVMILPTVLAPVGRGALQGARRFGLLGFGLAVSTLVRLSLGVVLVQAGFGVTGAVLGILFAETAAALLAIAPLRRGLRTVRVDRVLARSLLRESGSASAALSAFWLLVTVDVILARHYLPAAEAGRYAAAALIGRAILFLPGAIAVLVYPSFVARAATPEGRVVLRRALAAVLIIGVLASGVIASAPQTLRWMFGGAYASTGRVAPMLALAMTALGAVHLLLYQRLALRRSASILWLVVVAQTVAIVLLSGSAEQVATAMLVTGVLAFSLLLFGSSPRIRRPVATGELWQRPDAGIDLSVVTPTYNGEAVIGSSMTALISALESAGIRYEVIMVSDGCTDGTLEIARGFEADHVLLVHYDQNQGKGYALRTGLARASGRFVAFIDSDGDLDPVSLVHFLTLMQMYQADMVVGSKRHPLSDVAYPMPRRFMSWMYHRMVRLLFGIRISDTQTGVKFIRRQLLADVLPRLEEKRFAFDLELIVAARRAGYRRILEAPVVLRYQFASTISWRSVRGIMRDTASIWLRCHLGRRYDPVMEGTHPRLPEDRGLEPIGAMR